MPSDLELRAWLAEHLARLEGVRIVPDSGVCYFDGKYSAWSPAYEATWGGMGLVFEAMQARYYYGLVNTVPAGAYAAFRRAIDDPDMESPAVGPKYEGIADTAPMAAAKAAQAAIEAEKHRG